MIMVMGNRWHDAGAIHVPQVLLAAAGVAIHTYPCCQRTLLAVVVSLY